MQDTGFSSVLPVGDGVLTFQTMDEAIDRICDVTARYGHHCRAARQVAEEYFDSDKVLVRLIDTATASASDAASERRW